MFPNKYHYILVPGYGGIEMRHWMRHWLRLAEDISIVKQENFQEPEKDAWTKKLAELVAKKQDKPIVLIAHSLGCITTIYASLQNQLPGVVAAFLVAMPEEERPEFHNGEWKNFTPFPAHQIPFFKTMVYSDNDEYCSVQNMEKACKHFNIPMVYAGSNGHLGSSANLAEWKEGQELFTNFLKQL